MQIIDAFCGVGPWAMRDKLLPYQPADILAQMDHFGIDQALVFPNAATLWGFPPVVNEITLDACQLSPRFLPAYVIGASPYDASLSAEGYLAAMRTAGAKAAWFFPTARPPMLETLPLVMGEMLEALAAHRIPLFVHVEDRSPDLLHLLLRDYPDLPVVAVGASYGADPWLYPLLRAHANLYVCLGHFYIPSNGPMRFLEHFSPERLIFGSGLPQFSPGGLIGHVMYADIPETVKAQILAGNLLRLLAEVQL